MTTTEFLLWGIAVACGAVVGGLLVLFFIEKLEAGIEELLGE